MNESLAIELQIQQNDIASAMIELEAMKEANKQREIEGLAPVFSKEEFMKILEVYDLGYNNNITKMQRLNNCQS